MPNFLIIGAAKAGTTSLYRYLEQHPQIYMSPVKEPKFFAFEGETPDYCGPGDRYANRFTITDLEAYQAQFQDTTNETAVGEASALYLYSPKAVERIQHRIPNTKLIAILRHPVDRAYSSFLHLIREEREPLNDFAQALAEEEVRIHNQWQFIWHYKTVGFYSVQLKRYFDTFSQSQIRVYLFEDLATKPIEVVQNIFQFLEVDDTFVPDLSTQYNASIVPSNKAAVKKNEILHTFLTKTNPIKSILKPLLPVKQRQRLKTNLIATNLAKPTLALELRQKLLEEYREDILKLQDLIQRDLSQWLA
jgi:hypothetical protein